MSRLRLLGTGTCQLHRGRRASSILIELKKEKILFDFGHGIFDRLAELEVSHQSINHVIFSHYHPDHISDLIPFLHAGTWSRSEPRTKELHLWGPQGLEHYVNGFIKLFGPESLTRSDGYPINLHRIEAGKQKIGGLEIEFVSLPPADNHGIKFTLNNKVIAITGDSDFQPEEIAFLENVDIAIIDSGHLTEDQIIELAVRSKMKVMYCTHVYKELDCEFLQKAAGKFGFRGSMLLAEDLQIIE